MTENVSMPEKPMYRIESGGLARRIYGARKQAKREASTLVAQTLVDVPSTVKPEHQDWAYDLRRGRMSIYGGLLRFIDHCHRRNVPMETVLMIPEWIAAYVREIYLGTPAGDAVKVYRSGEYRKVG